MNNIIIISVLVALTSAWTPTEVRELILILFAQLSAILVLYFKFKKEAEKRAASVKEEVRQATKDIKASNAVTAREVNGMLRSIIDSVGVPAWVKIAIVSEEGNVSFRMLHLNREFEDIFNIRAEDYCAKTDHEIWPKDIADTFYTNDLEVFATGVPHNFSEIVNGKVMRFRKVRVSDRETGKIKGIYGHAIDCADPAHCPVHCAPTIQTDES